MHNIPIHALSIKKSCIGFKYFYMIVLSHPTGNANVRAAATGLNKSGLLTQFHTTIASFPNNVFDKLSKYEKLADIKRRSYDPSLSSMTKMWPWFELGRMIALKTGIKSLTLHEKGFFSVDAIYKAQDKWTAEHLQELKLSGIKGIYAYEDGAVISFTAAKKIDLKCLYDLPIGYWKAANRLLKGEIDRWPEYAPTLTGFSNSAEKLDRKDEELRLADTIFVASSFTASTLLDYDGKLAKVNIIPYGFPPVGNKKDYDFHKGKRKLKLLFVGGLSQRKGIADLFHVIKDFPDQVELTLVGKKGVNECVALNNDLSKHNWIPSLPHSEILKLMNASDVLVFPSLFEGFGLVITEAMSQGTPVVTTERTAGPDLITHNENGWLIEAGSTTGLKDAISYILDHPDAVEYNGKNARDTAKQRTWETYGLELAKTVKEQFDIL
jgi:glycosyltransferase involved in cell wall biosynthesis